MEFRKTIEEDIDYIMNIIKQAQEYFKEEGIDQWQNNYPNYETIKNDINNGESYVLIENNNIIATIAVSFEGESTYSKIYNGIWLTNDRYAVIHRVAVDNSYKGLGISSKIIKYVELLCLDKEVSSIKVDTHEQNMSMQKLLEKNSFVYCGKIYLEDGSSRIAFEKIL